KRPANPDPGSPGWRTLRPGGGSASTGGMQTARGRDDPGVPGPGAAALNRAVVSMPLTVLITGFGPFPGAPFNPTTALPRQLAPRRRPAFAEVKRIPHVFRTSYAAVGKELPALIARTRPDVVLLFGVATRTTYLRVELRARNARSPLFPDVDGERPNLSSIALGAPAVRSGRAPHTALLATIRAARLPVRLSHSAGRYWCNFAYWHALAATRGGDLPLVQFLHGATLPRGPWPPAARRPAAPP